ncbi:MAG: hypothetical protein ACI35V_12160 [Sphingobacterium composti]|uniref:hypothetical protein n=1 Tax=Sphingobacterium composti TaxID=363260 RepID=UPI00135709BB|nr:hypothetical protein [Sphingobacterium composti Ten et al. 2007 non Yoo et al. 2007]
MRLIKLFTLLLIVITLSACKKSKDMQEQNQITIDNKFLTQSSWQIELSDRNPELNPEGAIFNSFGRYGGSSCILFHKFTFTKKGKLIEIQNAPNCFYTKSQEVYYYILDEKNNKLIIKKFLDNSTTQKMEDVEYSIIVLNSNQLKLSYIDKGQLHVRSFKPYEK